MEKMIQPQLRRGGVAGGGAIGGGGVVTCGGTLEEEFSMASKITQSAQRGKAMIHQCAMHQRLDASVVDQPPPANGAIAKTKRAGKTVERIALVITRRPNNKLPRTNFQSLL
jgi:hypothetical protein